MATRRAGIGGGPQTLDLQRDGVQLVLQLVDPQCPAVQLIDAGQQRRQVVGGGIVGCTGSGRRVEFVAGADTATPLALPVQSVTVLAADVPTDATLGLVGSLWVGSRGDRLAADVAPRRIRLISVDVHAGLEGVAAVRAHHGRRFGGLCGQSEGSSASGQSVVGRRVAEIPVGQEIDGQTSDGLEPVSDPPARGPGHGRALLGVRPQLGQVVGWCR
jgi:hypothetical protein